MPIDLNSFNNYFSPFNALRVSKGIFWAILLFPLLKREMSHDAASKIGLTARRFALGMTLGVLAASLGVLWERAAFTGFFNFSRGYRVVGLFSGMHIGGAYIEAYFATSLPFVAWWTLSAHTRIKRLAGAIVFALGIYALVVTYARGAYLALAIGIFVLSIALHSQSTHAPRTTFAWRGFLLLLLLAVIALPVIEGTAMQRRYATSQRDLRARAAHWMDAITMMDNSFSAKIFGMGMGSYPRLYYLRNTENVQSALYMLGTDHGSTSLLLSTGEPIYIEQFVNLQSGKHYRLSFSARNLAGQSELVFPICEKWMLYSSNCISPSVAINGIDGQWRRYELDVDASAFHPRPWYARRPIKFSVFNDADNSVVAISNLSLRASDGAEYLSNGNFAAGMDHWFFTSDNHLPWHLENSWVQIYLEQGAFGLLMFFALVIWTILSLIKQVRSNNVYSAVLLASLSAFLTLSTFDSVFDFPRMSLLFYLLVLQALLHKTHFNFIGAEKHLPEK